MSRGLGDVYKRQQYGQDDAGQNVPGPRQVGDEQTDRKCRYHGPAPDTPEIRIVKQVIKGRDPPLVPEVLAFQFEFPKKSSGHRCANGLP